MGAMVWMLIPHPMPPGTHVDMTRPGMMAFVLAGSLALAALWWVTRLRSAHAGGHGWFGARAGYGLECRACTDEYPGASAGHLSPYAWCWRETALGSRTGIARFLATGGFVGSRFE